ncbi:hypothetical protein GTY54_49115, partial [Streptomyces sp. SID625]|nr:hypothetical protein [Streptomyces sp. SID625]
LAAGAPAAGVLAVVVPAFTVLVAGVPLADFPALVAGASVAAFFAAVLAAVVLTAAARPELTLTADAAVADALAVVLFASEDLLGPRPPAASGFPEDDGGRSSGCLRGVRRAVARAAR